MHRVHGGGRRAGEAAQQQQADPQMPRHHGAGPQGALKASPDRHRVSVLTQQGLLGRRDRHESGGPSTQHSSAPWGGGGAPIYRRAVSRHIGLPALRRTVIHGSLAVLQPQSSEHAPERQYWHAQPLGAQRPTDYHTCTLSAAACTSARPALRCCAAPCQRRAAACCSLALPHRCRCALLLPFRSPACCRLCPSRCRDRPPSLE